MRHRSVATTILAVAAGLLVAGVALAGVSKVSGGIEFTYEDPSAGSVSLAGDFNNWNMNAEPLTKGSDGVWRVVVDLEPGTYEYKFVVNGSEWIADPDNSVVVGDYGNSGLTINDDGEPVSGPAASAISNTPVNSRVMLNGWYRATYDTRSDVPNDPRWRLDRPVHEFYLQVNPTVTSVAKGSITLHMTTGTGDYKEISTDLYSGWATLEGGPFSVTGYDNEEILQYDDPLETVGHIDLAGTITEEHLKFGRGAQGVILDTDFWDFSLNASYSNIYDYYIYNNPSVYDNTGTDLITARLKRPVGPTVLGATYTSHKDGWWIGFEGTNTSPDITQYLADHPESQSSWFELSNTESWIGLDGAMPVVEELLDAKAEVAHYGFDSYWDVGNMEKVEGEDYANGAIDIPVGDMTGWAAKVILESQPMPVVDLRVETTKLHVDGMEADELYVSYGAPYWESEIEGQFTEVTGTGSPLKVGIYGPAPERDEIYFEFDGRLEFGIFNALVELDRTDYDWKYVMPQSSLPGDVKSWGQTASRFATTANAAVSERIGVGLAVERLWRDYDSDYYKTPSTFEAIATADVGLWTNWKLLLDLRSISYKNYVRLSESSTDSLVTDDQSFFEPYFALVYSPRENVEIRVGYGVNPVWYTDTPVEGRGDGRERWRSEYLWDHGLYDVLDAEKALEDARTIGIMGVLTF
jgi:hypothetical protein